MMESEKLQKDMEAVMNPSREEFVVPMSKEQEIAYLKKNIAFIQASEKFKKGEMPEEEFRKLQDEVGELDLKLPQDSPYMKGQTLAGLENRLNELEIKSNKEELDKKLDELMKPGGQYDRNRNALKDLGENPFLEEEIEVNNPVIVGMPAVKGENVETEQAKPEASKPTDKEKIVIAPDYFTTAGSFEELYTKMREAGMKESAIESLKNFREEFKKLKFRDEKLTENSPVFGGFFRDGGFRSKVFELLHGAHVEANVEVNTGAEKKPAGIGEAIVRSKGDIHVDLENIKPAEAVEEKAKPVEPVAQPNTPKTSRQADVAGEIKIPKTETKVIPEVAEKPLEKPIMSEEEVRRQRIRENQEVRKHGYETWSDKAQKALNWLYEKSGVERRVKRFGFEIRGANAIDRVKILFNEVLVGINAGGAKDYEHQIKQKRAFISYLRARPNGPQSRRIERVQDKIQELQNKMDYRADWARSFENDRNQVCLDYIQRIKEKIEPYLNRMDVIKADMEGLLSQMRTFAEERRKFRDRLVQIQGLRGDASLLQRRELNDKIDFIRTRIRDYDKQWNDRLKEYHKFERQYAKLKYDVGVWENKITEMERIINRQSI